MSVIFLLILVGQIPSFHIGSFNIKQINILSDIYQSDEAGDESSGEYADTSFQAESMFASERIAEALATPTGTSQSWDISPDGIVATPKEARAAYPAIPSDAAAPGSQATPPAQQSDMDNYGIPATLIEEFSPDGKGVNLLYKVLSSRNSHRPVRIGVLGDSFIESDIITADLREQLQQLFGGNGVGFVPFASPLAQYRGTVKHTFSGWETYNVLKKKSAPAAVQDRFFVSGLVCIPSEGAWTKIEGTSFRRNISRCQVARLLFTNTGNSVLDVTVNDSITNRFTPESSPLVQQISLNGDIRSIKVKITSAEGFTGYGIVLENAHGVSVDNFSIRSNSGMALFGTNSSINSQIGRLLGYDLIILQYGLNAMSPDVLNYNNYSAQLTKIISYIRDCFPSSAIMVMSVGDRSTQKAGEYVTMPAVRTMIAAQRSAAEKGGAAFWNTFLAMGGERSMVRYVDNKWAAKDYTHIAYNGGKQIATQMVRSLLYGYQGYCSGMGYNMARNNPVPGKTPYNGLQ